MRTTDHATTPDDPTLPRTLHVLAASAQELLERVEHSTPKLGAMIDILGSWLGAHTGPTLRLPEPVYAVAPCDDGRWLVVRMDGDDDVVANVAWKATAVELARTAARADEGTLVLHRSDGSLQATYHYGIGPADEPEVDDGVVVPFVRR